MGKQRKTPYFFGPSEPTPEERAWMRRAARVLAECPPTLWLWSNGDKCVTVTHAIEAEELDRWVGHCHGDGTRAPEQVISATGVAVGVLPSAVHMRTV